MADDSAIAIEATEQKYFVLKHMPGRLPLDADGKGTWPADQFTFRLIEEGALRVQSPAQTIAAGEATVGPWSNPNGVPLPPAESAPSSQPLDQGAPAPKAKK